MHGIAVLIQRKSFNVMCKQNNHIKSIPFTINELIDKKYLYINPVQSDEIIISYNC
jgi:hypothetical protein